MEIEGGSGGGGAQLYAGRPAFGSTAKETSGHEPVERDWREVENERFRRELESEIKNGK
jgi:cytochrome c oxidase assembly factor 5